MTDKPFVIRPEVARDFDEICTLHRLAFDDAKIADLVSDLRGLDGPLSTQALVAEASDKRLVGHVMLSHAWLDSDTGMIDVMVLSPLGVLPSEQGKGIGKALIAVALTKAETLGAPMVFLEGNPRIYSGSGFENAGALGVRRPSLRIPDNAFQVKLLSRYSSEMTGTFVYRDVHWKHGVGLYRN